MIHILRIHIIGLLLLLPSLALLYAQETKLQDDDPNERYAATLQYGIDSSVVDVIKTLRELTIAGYEETVLNRIENTKSEELAVEGIAYLRDVEYKDKKVIEFCLGLISDYEILQRRVVQHAIFYIGDNTDLLSDEDKSYLNNLTLDIVETEIASIALAILELLPKYYSEKDIPYLERDEEDENENKDKKNYKKEMFIEEELDTIVDINGTSDSSDSGDFELTYDSLLSTQIKNIYEEISTTIIKNQILLGFGEILAYNQVDFLIEVSENQQEAHTLKTQAIAALAYFEDISDEAKEKLDILFETEKDNKVPEVRSSILNALEIIALRTDEEKYINWIREKMRDNEMVVRKQALKSLRNLYDNGKGISTQSETLQAIKYMVSYDPESAIKTEAVKTLATLEGGELYLVDEIKKIEYISHRTKALIDIGVSDIADQGGIEAIEEVLIASIEKRNNSLIEYIAGAMSKKENKNFERLVRLLLPYRNSTVLMACLTTIGKNNFTSFDAELEAMSKDIGQSSNVRNRAREILKLEQKK